MQRFLAANYKHLVMAGMWLLVLVGVAQAVSNLPVFTGCGYYGNCAHAEKTVASDPMTERVEKED